LAVLAALALGGSAMGGVDPIDTTADTYVGDRWGLDLDANFGSSNDLNCRGGDYDQRLMYQFDVSGTEPAIESATLTFRIRWTEPVDVPLSVYRVTSAWEEGTVTYNTHGNAYAPASGVDVTVSALRGEWVEISGLQDIVQYWKDNPGENYGLIVINTQPDNDNYLDTNAKEESEGLYTPQLLVNSFTPVVDVSRWGSDAAGDWNDGASWAEGASPNGNTKTAVLGAAILADRTVYTDTDVKVKEIQFDNANSYVIAGAGSVNLEADTDNAAITVAQGDHEFQAPVNLVSETDVTVAGGSLTFNNALNLGGNSLNVLAGTVNINNVQTGTPGTLNLSGGRLGGSGAVGGALNSTGGTVAPGNSAGTLTVEGDYTQAADGTLEIELAGAGEGEFDVLAVTGDASLDGVPCWPARSPVNSRWRASRRWTAACRCRWTTAIRRW
jgi:hypothetical protein